jgi:hypothetical protein
MKTEHLVPLGPNVTRDGRTARVLCNDRICPGNVYPVLAIIQISPNEEVARVFYSDGRMKEEREHPLDLVGHLPPEPAKPREWLIFRNPAGEPQIRSGPAPAKHEYVHVREVLPGEDDELKELRQWKAESIPYIRNLETFIGNLRQPAVSARVAADADKLLER